MSQNEDRKTILLVDDDIDLIEQNKVILEQNNFNVITAESGAEGWTKFTKHNPDICVIDLIMEEMDSGFILCHKIKNDPQGKNIPVFILTSATYETGIKFSAATEEEREWIKCDGLLHKPVIIEEFLNRVEQLDGKNEALQNR